MPVVKEQSKIETIKTLFVSVTDKTRLITKIAEHETINTKFLSLRNTWFSNYRGWSIPDEHQDTVLNIIRRTINDQNDDNN